jgi:phosphoribosylglycinamide formyltransferase-1
MPAKPRLGVLLSGRVSNFGAIARNVISGKLPCEIGMVFSNKPDAAGLELARELGLPHMAIKSAGVERTAFDTQVAELLKEHRID